MMTSYTGEYKCQLCGLKKGYIGAFVVEEWLNLCVDCAKAHVAQTVTKLKRKLTL